MNLDGFQPYPIERFSSLVEQDDPTNLPTGVSPVARNVKFVLTRVKTRDGIQNNYGFTLPDGGAVSGLAAQKVGGPSGDLQVPIAYSNLGYLYQESPVGSGQVVPIIGPLVTLPAQASMQVAAVFKNAYLAFGDLKNSLASPAVYNPTLKTLDPLSMLPVGNPWQANTQYQLGECVTPATPVGGNGRLYQCTQAGKSGAVQPNFPSNTGSQITASGVNHNLGGTAWTNPNNVTQTDLATFATVTLVNNGDISQFLQCTQFGLNLTANAIITGIVVKWTGSASKPATIQPVISFNGVRPPQEQNIVNLTPAVLGYSSGGASDSWALAGTGVLVPATVVNAATFGVEFRATAQAAGAIVSIQNVQITIYYGFPGPIIDGGVIWTDVTPTIGSSALAGNIAFGLRYMVVLFVNRNGYISGMSPASVASATIGDSVHQLQVNFPTGPLNTIARILAFTPAGQLGQLAGTGISSAGPYFWIEPNFPNGIFNLSAIPGGVTVAEVVSGVTMNSTLINDNVSTTATLNFTDDYLKATLNDVSSYFRKIRVPGSSDIYYSQVLQRMLFAADNLPSGWYVSLQNDPESVYGDTGLIQAAENNGENRTAVRDYAGVCYLMKEKSGYALVPTADDPTKWNAIPQWSGSGPCGPRAVDVATNFMCYIHRSGVYIFEGGQPYRISKEIPITWSQINWSVQQTFWVMIDDETREIRIGVAYGQSTVPNIVLKCNYEELPSWSPPSFAPPIHFSPYVGKEIAAGGCYKWSIDDLPANLCIRAERTLAPPANGWPVGFDLPTTQSQILFASANADGHVDPIIPGALDDNGGGIDSYVETACPQIVNGDGKVVKSLMGPSRLGGVQLNIGGTGQGGVLVLGWRAQDPKQGGPPLVGRSQATVGSEIRLKKPWIAGIPYSCGGSMTNERMRLRITNDKQPGVAFDLKWGAIYAQPVTSAR